jgi:hypothetical protein
MHVSNDEQDEFDTGLWAPLESQFVNEKDEVNPKLVSAFFRDFWMTSGDHIAPADTFESFESRYKGGVDLRQLTDQLTASAAQTTRPRKVSPIWRRGLRRTMRWFRPSQPHGLV